MVTCVRNIAAAHGFFPHMRSFSKTVRAATLFGLAVVATTALAAAGFVGPAQAGGLDRSYGEDGRVVLKLEEVPDPDGHVFRRLEDMVVDRAGHALALVGTDPAMIARFRPDGELDASFGEDGILDLSVFPSGRLSASAIALDNAGRLLVVAHDTFRPVNCPGRLYLVRLNPDGSADTTFSEDGYRLLEELGHNFSADGIEVDQRDRIYIGGGFSSRCGNWTAKPSVVRLHEDGTLDRSYAKDGIFTVDRRRRFGAFADYIEDFALDDRGRAALAASGCGKPGALEGCRFRGAVLRLRPNGTLDEAFGPSGIQRAFNLKGDVAAVAVDGKKTVLAGSKDDRFNRSHKLIVVRLNKKGKNDRRFNGGKARIISSHRQQVVSDLLLAHQRIIVGATRGTRVDDNSGRDMDFLVAMLKQNGGPDRGFGRRGIVGTSFESNAIAQVLAPAPDRSFILGGSRPWNWKGDRLFLARYRR